MSNHRARTWDHKGSKSLDLKFLPLDHHLDGCIIALLVYQFLVMWNPMLHTPYPIPFQLFWTLVWLGRERDRWEGRIYLLTVMNFSAELGKNLIMMWFYVYSLAKVWKNFIFLLFELVKKFEWFIISWFFFILSFSRVYLSFFINIGIRVSLRVPRLISRALKLTTM